MKRSIRSSITVALAAILVTGMAWPAMATGPITRLGIEQDGIRNPGGCRIQPEGSDLHVNCKCASGNAFIRFRFLRDVGAVRAPATVSAEIRGPAGCSEVRWMGPVRTLRIEVHDECYVHIASVTWSQP